MAQYLMGLDLGSKKGCCLLLDVESGDAVSTCRPWQHRMTAGFGYDLDTVEYGVFSVKPHARRWQRSLRGPRMSWRSLPQACAMGR